MGGALADLAFGAACPCGKLAETLPKKLDGAEHLHFASHPRQVNYRELYPQPQPLPSPQPQPQP